MVETMGFLIERSFNIFNYFVNLYTSVPASKKQPRP